MFVSGETGEPNAETTGIIEEIVRGQVIEMVRLPFALCFVQFHLPDNFAAPAVHHPGCSSWLSLNLHR